MAGVFVPPRDDGRGDARLFSHHVAGAVRLLADAPVRRKRNHSRSGAGTGALRLGTGFSRLFADQRAGGDGGRERLSHRDDAVVGLLLFLSPAAERRDRVRRKTPHAGLEAAHRRHRHDARSSPCGSCGGRGVRRARRVRPIFPEVAVLSLTVCRRFGARLFARVGAQPVCLSAAGLRKDPRGGERAHGGGMARRLCGVQRLCDVQRARTAVRRARARHRLFPLAVLADDLFCCRHDLQQTPRLCTALADRTPGKEKCVKQDARDRWNGPAQILILYSTRRSHDIVSLCKLLIISISFCRTDCRFILSGFVVSTVKCGPFAVNVSMPLALMPAT